jgi:hypothetical protein
MKVLTLHQPWASLVALGVKTIETPSWSTQYRGPLAIHAGAKAKPCTVGEYGFIPAHKVATDLFSGTTHCLWSKWGWVQAPLGAIVATCTLVDVVPIGGRGEMDRSTKRLLWTGHVDGILCLEDYRTGSSRNVEDQRPYGDFTPGRYAWLLADVVPVDPPVPFKGGQGLTKTWEPALCEALR